MSQSPSPQLVTNWLRDRSLEELKDKFSINYKRHKEFPNLVSLKYAKVGANFNDTLVRECRGLIVDEADGWRVVARSFSKFGNIGESYVPEMDWKTVRFVEKLDGSLMILYYYKHNWRVATSGTPDALGEVNGLGMTFKDLFWDTWNYKRMTPPMTHHEHLTFMFELMTPFNKVVVDQKVRDLKLIGVRERDSGLELPTSNFLLWEAARFFTKISTLDDATKSFEQISATRQEGYVVVDQHYNRAKIKHPEYVRLHRLRDNLTPLNILTLIQTDSHTETLNHFPEWTEVFEKIEAAYDGLCIDLQQYWNDIKDVDHDLEPRARRKSFATLANHAKMPSVMFDLYDKKHLTIRASLNAFRPRLIMNILGIDNLIQKEVPTVIDAEN